MTYRALNFDEAVSDNGGRLEGLRIEEFRFTKGEYEAEFSWGLSEAGEVTLSEPRVLSREMSGQTELHRAEILEAVAQLFEKPVRWLSGGSAIEGMLTPERAEQIARRGNERRARERAAALAIQAKDPARAMTPQLRFPRATFVGGSLAKSVHSGLAWAALMAGACTAPESLGAGQYPLIHDRQLSFGSRSVHAESPPKPAVRLPEIIDAETARSRYGVLSLESRDPVVEGSAPSLTFEDRFVPLPLGYLPGPEIGGGFRSAFSIRDRDFFVAEFGTDAARCPIELRVIEVSDHGARASEPFGNCTRLQTARVRNGRLWIVPHPWTWPEADYETVRPRRRAFTYAAGGARMVYEDAGAATYLHGGSSGGDR